MEVLRFVYNGATTSFNNNEVQQLEHFTVHPHLLKKLYSGYGVQQIGLPYNKFKISFAVDEGDTLSKLETLWGYVDSFYDPAIIQCYWKYNLDANESKQVQMNRGQMRWEFTSGKIKRTIIPIDFYEAVPANEAVVQLTDNIGT